MGTGSTLTTPTWIPMVHSHFHADEDWLLLRVMKLTTAAPAPRIWHYFFKGTAKSKNKIPCGLGCCGGHGILSER